MPLNSYATLGRSGLRVSPFCLGAMTFGEEWGWGATPEDSSKILGAFLERGGNFVDTANFYTKGHSEKIIGDFIAQDRAASSEWFWPKALCSKFSVLNYSGRDRMQDEVEHYPVAVPR